MSIRTGAGQWTPRLSDWTHNEHPLDREHYVEKQLKPVAEPVLAVLGLAFEQAIGDQRQIEMF